jgi:hypothetical protein
MFALRVAELVQSQGAGVQTLHCTLQGLGDVRIPFKVGRAARKFCTQTRLRCLRMFLLVALKCPGLKDIFRI